MPTAAPAPAPAPAPAGTAPRHQLLAEHLVAQIRSGEYPIGSLLPTELELCTAHDMARGTVRQALDRLQQLGMITRARGLGSTVISDRPCEPYRAEALSTDDMRHFVATTRFLPASSRHVTAGAQLARELDVPRRSKWLVLEGVRVRRGPEDEEPVCWSIQYLRSDTDEHVVASYGVLVEPSYRIEQTISADILAPAIAAALRAEPASAALVVTRRITEPGGRTVSVGIHIHRADRHKVTSVVQPGATARPQLWSHPRTAAPARTPAPARATRPSGA